MNDPLFHNAALSNPTLQLEGATRAYAVLGHVSDKVEVTEFKSGPL